MRLIVLMAMLAALLQVRSAPSAVAQGSTWQTVSNPAGYQYQVPPEWLPSRVMAPTETFMISPDLTEAAYVVVRAPNGATPAARLQVLTKNALIPASNQSAYAITNPSSPVQVPGADLADGGAATFVDRSGTPGREFIIAAIKGTTGYALIVDLPIKVDTATPNLAQTILGSFQLSAAPLSTGVSQALGSPTPSSTPISAPPFVASPPAPVPSPTPVPTPGPLTSNRLATPLYASDFDTDIAGVSGIAGAQVSQDTANAMFGSHSLKVVTPGDAPIEGAAFASVNGAGGDVYSLSAWVTAPTGATLTLVLAVDGVGSFATTDFTGTGAAQYVTATGTCSGSGTQPIDWSVRTNGAQAITFWLSAVQIEPGTTATPFAPANSLSVGRAGA